MTKNDVILSDKQFHVFRKNSYLAQFACETVRYYKFLTCVI